MRAFKIMALTVLLTVIALSITLAWLVRTENGSRWLLEQGLAFSPVTIEAKGITGTLAKGLRLDTLDILLPQAEIRAVQITLSWTPASLLAGVVDIGNAHIAELGIDILQTESSGDPVDDLLFWLQIPLDIVIESGKLDRLRIDKAVFENLNLAGNIGHGRLDVESLNAQIAGFELYANGELVGPAPGRLQVMASWEMPAQNLKGNGSFNGDIEKLDFTQVVNVPEKVDFTGSIHDLFSGPTLTGLAVWSSVRLPGETSLYSKNGKLNINSDFLSARLQGNSIMFLDDWPQAPLQISALVDLQGVTIDSYTIQTLDGQVTGSGRIDYADGLQGRLALTGSEIDTGLINSDLPGRLGFDAILLLESADAFAINVAMAKAKIAGKAFNGAGHVKWRESRLNAIDGTIKAGKNQLSADVTLDKQLVGAINVNAPELAMLWPGLEGELDAAFILGGSLEHPRLKAAVKALSVSFGTQSLKTISFNGELLDNDRLTGQLSATGLVTGEQRLGDLDISLAGTVSEHRSTLKLSDGVVDVELRASGGWDGQTLNQRFEYGLIRPEGFGSWRLQQDPQLSITSGAGKVSAHCWKQQDAGICIDASSWDANTLQSAVVINDFEFATLKPLLAEGYSIDGTVNANLEIMRDAAGSRGQLHWRQSRTRLAFADDIDKFQTVLDEVKIDVVSDTSQTLLDAKLNGEQGLNMIATASVDGPLAPDSPLKAEANGKLPSIGLLRPLLQRVLQPGELQGELSVDLDVGGTLGDPLFTGGAYLANGKLGLIGAGVTLSDINIAAQSKGTDRLLVTGDLRSGDGHADIQGEIRAIEDTELEAEISIRGQDLATVRIPDLSVDTSPDLKLRIGEGIFDISGVVLIPRAMAQIHDLPKNAVPSSSDVVMHAAEGAEETQQGTIITGNVKVILGDDVRFKGFGLDSRLDGELSLTQTRGGFLRSGGTVRVRDGFLTGYGKELRVDRGNLTFTGPLDDPLIDIQVSRESIYEGRQYTIGLRLTGSAQNVKTEPFSRPAMSDNDVLSFLLLDRPSSSDSDASGAALALGLQQLLPDQSGRFGLDEVSFETNDANEAAMVAGKRINEKLYVRYVFGTLGTPGSFRIRYTLGRGFSLEASTGARQSMDLIYLLER